MRLFNLLFFFFFVGCWGEGRRDPHVRSLSGSLGSYLYTEYTTRLFNLRKSSSKVHPCRRLRRPSPLLKSAEGGLSLIRHHG